MRLMILENQRLRNTLRFSGGVLSIGSDPHCEVHLPDSRIGFKQASLSQDEGGAWWLEVHDTTVPTALNRTVQKGRAKVRHADEIAVGNFSIRLFLESEKTREELQRQRMLNLTRQHGETLPLDTIVRRFEEDVTVSKAHIEEISLLCIRLALLESVKDLFIPLLRALIRGFEGKRAWLGIRRLDSLAGPRPAGSVHSGGVATEPAATAAPPADALPRTIEFEWSITMNHDGQLSDQRPAFSQAMQARCIHHTQFLAVPQVPHAGVASAMAAPLVCQTGNLGMIYVENDTGDPPYTEASLAQLSAVACSVAMTVENAVRKSALQRRSILNTELAIARATQDATTPTILPKWERIELAAYRHMGTQRCCDYYDVVQLRDKTAMLVLARLNFGGALVPKFFGQLQAVFRTAALYGEAPHLFARMANWLLSESDAKHTMDMAVVSIVPETGRMQSCRAGPGVHLARIGADGRWEMMSAGVGPALGASRTVAFESQASQLRRGDGVTLFSEGVNSAVNAAGEVFGPSGLEEIVADGMGEAPGAVLNELATELGEFVNKGRAPDDVTVLLARWK